MLMTLGHSPLPTLHSCSPFSTMMHLQGTPLNPMFLTISSALVSEPQSSKLVMAPTKILKVYTHLFQPIRAPVPETCSIDTRLHTCSLVCRGCPYRAARHVFGSPVDISRLFRNIGGLDHTLSDFPIPPFGQVSRSIRRQTIQVVDGTPVRFICAVVLADWYTQVFISWTGKQHEYFASLHEKYGDIVRTGESCPF